jgi:hypothetical protein
MQFKKLRRQYPKEAALDVILDVINEMSLPENSNDLSMRKKWMQWLELIARHIEMDIPRSLSVSHDETDRWIHERAKGAAAGLRRVIRQVAVSGPNMLDRVIPVLRAEAIALACGDLASLSYAKPPTQEPQGKRWKRIAVTAGRTILVMAAPIAAVLVLQAFSAFTPNGLSWAKLISLAWALLYLLITIDPTLNDKITTARNIIDTVRETRPPRSAHSVDDGR